MQYIQSKIKMQEKFYKNGYFPASLFIKTYPFF